MTGNEPQKKLGTTDVDVHPASGRVPGDDLVHHEPVMLANVDDLGKEKTLAEADDSAVTHEVMRKERSSKRRQRFITAYAQHRLGNECRGTHGAQAAVARATGFSAAHISNVIKENIGVGDDLAEELEKWWGLPPGDLSRVAEAWYASNVEDGPFADAIKKIHTSHDVALLQQLGAILSERIAALSNPVLEKAKVSTTPRLPPRSSAAPMSSAPPPPASDARADSATKRRQRKRTAR